jgi:hypothetical protein
MATMAALPRRFPPSRRDRKTPRIIWIALLVVAQCARLSHAFAIAPWVRQSRVSASSLPLWMASKKKITTKNKSSKKQVKIKPNSNGFGTSLQVDPALSRTNINPNDDLTSLELSLRFQEVLAHFQTTNEMTDSQVRENMLRTRHADLHLARCEIKQSTAPNAGLGLFATRRIARGEIITLYPGDALLKWTSADDVEDRDGVQVLLGPHISSRERDLVSKGSGSFFGQGADKARLYEARFSGTHSLVGDPGRMSDPAYLGHMLNDCFCLTSPKDRARYNKESQGGANARIELGTEGCHVAVVATKPIESGEECWLSYGEDYWLTRSVQS